MDRHVIEALGRTRVVIKDGKVVEVGMPEIEYCPLFAKVRNIQIITPEAVRENIEFRIRDFGMCTPHRKMRMRDYLSFGVSELLGMAVSKGMLDAAVVVCEGAGTAVVSDPEVIQGSAAGFPASWRHALPEVIEAIGRDMVLDARAQGSTSSPAPCWPSSRFKRVGVSVAKASDARRIRDEFGQRVGIFAVHTSGRTKEEAEGSSTPATSSPPARPARYGPRPSSAHCSRSAIKVPIYAASLWRVPPEDQAGADQASQCHIA